MEIDINITDKFKVLQKGGISAIQEAMGLSAYEYQEKQRHSKLYNLAQEDLAHTIRRNVCYDWADNFLLGAYKWLGILTTKYDKRRKYDEKVDYDFLTSMFRQAFCKDHIDIIDMTLFGYDNQAYRVEFITDSDYVYYVTIPNIKNLTVKNMVDVHYGQLAFGYKLDKCSYKQMAISYNLCDFVSTMSEIQFSSDCKAHYSKVETGWVPSWLEGSDAK
jgi:hypothetical protein